MKKLLIVLGIIVLVIVIAIGALFYGIKSYLTPEKVSALISGKLESAIHHKVKLGPISTGFSSANIQGFTLLSNNPKETIPLAKVKSVSISFSLMALLRKKLEIGKVLVDSPEIYMVREKDGKLNWQKEFAKVSLNFEGGKARGKLIGFSLVSEAVAAEAKTEPKGFVIQVGRAEITNGTLKWVDRTLSPVYKADLTSLRIDLSNFSLDAPFDFELKGTLKREKESGIVAKGTMDLKKKDMKGVVTLSSLYLPDISPYLKGQNIEALAGTGNLNLQFTTRHFEEWDIDQTLDLASVILKAQGRKSPEIAAKLKTKASLDLKKGHLLLKNLEGNVLDSDFKVTGELSDMKTVPKGAFQFTSNKMDVDTLMGLAGIFSGPPEKGKKGEKKPAVSKGKSSPAPKKGKPSKKPSTMLPTLTIDAKIHLLTVQKLKIEEIVTKIVTKGHTMVMDPLTAKVYGGTVQGKLNVDLQGGIPVIKKKISIKNVDIAPLLSDMKPGMKERFTGRFFGDAQGGGMIGAPSTYQGDVSFHVENGSVQHVAFLKMAAAIMKLPSLANLQFEVLDGKAKVRDKKIEILSTKAKGKDISVDTHGIIGFDKKIDLLTVLTLPYRVVRKALGKRSDLFKDVTDKGGRKWSLIPIQAKGSLDHPRVSVKFQKEAIDKIIEKNIHDKKLKKIFKKLFN
ncbi:MAG: AsmA family protein [Deltaproteobacteria bacterium]|nr:AsmA family protein [Deltaproteobacteria bacterium]